VKVTGPYQPSLGIDDMQIDDIDWRSGEVIVRGKGNRHDRVPLPPDVGEALADYIKSDRKTSSRALFVTERAPHRPFKNAQLLTRCRAGSPSKEAYVTFNSKQCARREPLYDIDPQTGVSIEVFYADRALETFSRRGAGWFWWFRRRGFSPNGSPTGPFAMSYAAYRHALNAATSSSSATHGASLADLQR